MKALIITAVSALTALTSHAVTTDVKEFTAKNIIRLDIENRAGSVNISGQNTDKITVTAEKIKFSDKCSISYKQSDDEIKIESEKKSFFGDNECLVNLTIVVPKKIDLNLQSASSNFEISGTSGKINLKVASGNVNIKSEVNDLDAKSGSGDLTVHGMTGNADILIGSGKIKLTYTKDPGTGELNIITGSGNTDLYFPPKMRVHSKTIVGSGETYNELGDFKDAKFLISFKAGSGDLNIKKANEKSEAQK